MKIDKILEALNDAKQRGIEDVHVYIDAKNGVCTNVNYVSVSDLTSVDFFLEEEIVPDKFKEFKYKLFDKVKLKCSTKTFTICERYLVQVGNGSIIYRYGLADENLASYECEENVIQHLSI